MTSSVRPGILAFVLAVLGCRTSTVEPPRLTDDMEPYTQSLMTAIEAPEQAIIRCREVKNPGLRSGCAGTVASVFATTDFARAVAICEELATEDVAECKLLVIDNLLPELEDDERIPELFRACSSLENLADNCEQHVLRFALELGMPEDMPPPDDPAAMRWGHDKMAALSPSLTKSDDAWFTYFYSVFSVNAPDGTSCMRLDAAPERVSTACLGARDELLHR